MGKLRIRAAISSIVMIAPLSSPSRCSSPEERRNQDRW